MAYDGLFIKLQIGEIKDLVLNEHISKITQSSHKEVDFHIRKNSQNYILSLSANPNFPHIMISTYDKGNLSVPPSFCMLLRKYLQGGLIKSINQVNSESNEDCKNNLYLERILKIEIENINENGDIATYFIYFEIMGKYSNIVITDSDNIILDVLLKTNTENKRLSIKSKYETSEIANKSEILYETVDNFIKNINSEIALSKINNESIDLSNIISKKYSGLSKPLILHIMLEYLKENKINLLTDNFTYKSINKYFSNDNDYENLFIYLKNYISDVLENRITISVTINYKNNKASDFYLFKLLTYQGEIKSFENINTCLETFINNRFQTLDDSSDKKNLQSIIKSLYIKLNKKLDIYKKDLSKCEDADKYKNYGELISCFGYDNNNIKDGILTCNDYNNNNETVYIPIDTTLSVAKNVEKYYDKYNKLKRTKDNVDKLITEANNKLEHLNTIEQSLSLSNDKNDIYLVKEEIIKYFDEANKIKGLSKQKADYKDRNISKAKNKSHSKQGLNYNIHHYKSSSGIDIYVGKNNLQNEYLTFTLANADDTWLHIKNATGSHVIIKKPYEKLDDQTLVEAASLAAYFSEKRNETKATVDYTLRKELKKVKGKSPGFCIYHKNFSINVKPEILIKEI